MKIQKTGLTALFVLTLLALAPWPATAGKKFAPQADAMLVPGDAANYGQGKAIVGGGGRSMLLKFGNFPTPPGIDLKSNPPSTYTLKATLHFYVKNWNGVEGHILINGVASDWEETTVSGTTPLDRSGRYQGTQWPVNGAGRWYTMDFTYPVVDWLYYPNNPQWAPRSFELVADGGLQVSIAGRESGEFAPYLEVTLLKQPPFYHKRAEFEVDVDGYEDFLVECDYVSHPVLGINAWSERYGLLPQVRIHKYRATVSYRGSGLDTIYMIATCWNPGLEEWN